MKAMLTTLLALLLCEIASAQQNQFWLAAQHEWGAKQGFFFTLSAQSTATASLDDVKLEAGIGDGRNWRFLSAPAKWQYHKPYTAKLVLTPGAAELWLDGQRLEQAEAKLAAVAHSMAMNEQPSFLRTPANYIVRQTRLFARSAATTIDESFDAAFPPQLLLFNPAAGAERKEFVPGERCTLEATFRFEPAPDLRKLAPFIDRYGQSIHANWDGKVSDDADLLAAERDENKRLEQWRPPDNRDPFGGIIRAGFRENPTGFFRVIKRNDKWWLITPHGNPCFYIGLCDAPALDWEATPASGREFLFQWLPDSEFSRTWIANPWHRPEEEGNKYIAFHTANLIRKYGSREWETRAAAAALKRSKALGFAGYGKWCAQQKDVPYAPVIYHFDVPNLARHPDIFDPAIRKRFAESLRRQVEPRKDDPYIIGWSVGNEFEECISASDITKILAMADDVPARRALLAHAPASEVESLRRFYADAYYDFIYKTIKSVDPNHLYLGFWVTPNWWENGADWDLMANHCDVIGYDFYGRAFTAGPMKALLERQDKPAICGEFSCPPDYGGSRGYGRYHVYSRDETEAGQIYANWLAEASKHPRCVGVFYFQYRDQPLTGRGPVTGPGGLVIGEDFAFGIVDVADRLKYPFVEQIRKANLAAAAARFE